MRTILALLVCASPATFALAEAPNISGEAQALLKQVSDAYGKLTTLQVEGKMTSRFDLGGQQPRNEAQIIGQADSGGRFYTAIVGESHMIGNGTKTYMYDFHRNNFVELDAISARSAMEKLPKPLPTLVRDENPSVLMAICTDPASVLTLGCTEVRRVDDTKIDDVACPTLELAAPYRQMRVMIDPKTSLIRRVEIDYSATYKKAGVPDVKSALVTMDYTRVVADAKLDEKIFAWVPPRGAYPMKSRGDQMQDDDSGAPGEGVEALKGKELPAVELKDLNGDDVKVADLKGKVVVLDFWATWCGPCVQLMPHVVKMNETFKDKDVVIYGVNCGETPEKVKKFLESKEFDLKVLFDSDNSTQKRFGISGIPTTIIVGKDGIVRLVSVGAGPDTPKKIEAAVEQALDEK